MYISDLLIKHDIPYRFKWKFVQNKPKYLVGWVCLMILHFCLKYQLYSSAAIHHQIAQLCTQTVWFASCIESELYN